MFHVSGIDGPRFENVSKSNVPKIESSDPSNLTKYATANTNYGSNNENTVESFMNRPATALLKVIDKFSSFSGLGYSANSLSKTGMAVGGTKEKSNVILAHQLQSKIEKLIKVQSKLLVLQSEVSYDLGNWASYIPDQECEILVKEFSTLINSQHDSNRSVLEKLEKLKLSFKFVNQREKKLRDLINTKKKIVRDLRDNEVKYGPNASSSTLLNEKLEETIWNLDVLEQQYIRSISKDLKDSLVEFAAALQSVSANLNDSTSEYYNCLINLETSADITRSSPKKYINQLGIGMKNGKDFSLASSNVFNKTRTANDLENPYSKPTLARKENEYRETFDPLKINENQRNQNGKGANVNICTECLKTNRYSRLITPCTHNTQNSDNESVKNNHLNPSPSRLSNNDTVLDGFRIRDPTFQPPEQWG